MGSLDSKGLVLVTGANGFIAAQTVHHFLEAGYSVRGTVRSIASSQSLLDALKYYGSRFSLVEVPDITAPHAFDDAVKGVDFIAHLAAPVSFMFTDPEPVLKAAVEGTTGILESAARQGSAVKHFVLMSSIVAVLSGGKRAQHVLTEKDWNEDAEELVRAKGKEAGGYAIYQASKTAAEKAFWKFQSERKPSFTMAAVNPVFVAGPSLVPYTAREKMTESLWMLYDVLAGKDLDKAGLPAPSYSYVDVRDVARMIEYSVAHPEETDGERYILAAVNGPPQSVADILREALPEKKDVIKEGQPGKGYLPGYAWDVKSGRAVDNGKSRRALGAYTPWEKTVVDSARSFDHLL